MPVPMELSRIIISEINDNQVIYLKEIDGQRTFPILIGIFEATSIDRRVKGYPSPRPLTHDLIVSVVEQLGGEFQDVVISELEEIQTKYGPMQIIFINGTRYSWQWVARNWPGPYDQGVVIHETGHALAVMEVEDWYHVDHEHEARMALRTTDEAHPGVQYLPPTVDQAVGSTACGHVG